MSIKKTAADNHFGHVRVSKEAHKKIKTLAVLRNQKISTALNTLIDKEYQAQRVS